MKFPSASLFALALVPAVLLIGCGDEQTSFVPDTTPPLAPVVQGAAGSEIGVNLWWQQNPEPDLVGYNVYVIETGLARRANDYLITTSYYAMPMSGGSVRMYVTAVDAAGNESGPSSSRTVSAGSRSGVPVVDRDNPDLDGGL
jgi:hypothetical protein